jgi:hypothetical protein
MRRKHKVADAELRSVELSINRCEEDGDSAVNEAEETYGVAALLTRKQRDKSRWQQKAGRMARRSCGIGYCFCSTSRPPNSVRG